MNERASSVRLSKQGRPWHKKRVSSGADAILFFLVFAGGGAGILLLKEQSYQQYIVTAFPCGLLVLYAAIVKFVPRFQLREDQAGDNCYYLGFLFTLVSLSLALIAFVEAGSTAKIVEDFGIALGSTIFGLVLRVAFNQMRQDPVEIEREARLELAAAAQRLRSELDQSVFEMNAFRRATQQSIVDGMEELNGKIRELLEKNLLRYDEITRGSAERIDQTLAAFADNSSRLNGVAEQTAATIEALAARIEKIRAPEDLVETKLAPAVAAITDMVTELKLRAGAESKEFRQLRKLIGEASATTGGLAGQVADISKALKGLSDLTSTLGTAERRLAALAATLEEAGTALASGSEARRQALAADAEAMKAVLAEVLTAVTSAGNELRRELSEPAREAGAALMAIAAQAQSLREIEAQLKRLPGVLEDQISTISRVREESSSSRGFSSIFRSSR